VLRHLPLRELGYAVGFLVLLAALYVGAYFATVERSLFGAGINADWPDQPWLPWYPRIESEWTHPFFAPMHVVDLKLRPDYWDGK
jgi:hypothetical protein